MSQNLELSRDAKTIFVVRSVRGFASGFGSLLLGTTLKSLSISSLHVGLVLGAAVAGNVVTSLAVAKWSDKLGLRRSYSVFFVVLAISGLVLAFTNSLLMFIVVALTGTLSTDMMDNGPFTSLEQSMLGRDLNGNQRISGFGIFNAFAALAASFGALATGLPHLLRLSFTSLPPNQRFFLVIVPLALTSAIIVTSLSSQLEAPANVEGKTVRTGLGRSEPTVRKLSALFAADAFGGGFIVQSFITYWFEVKFHTTIGTLGVAFFAIGLLQSVSFIIATFFAKRFGLLRTMVFSHLPSNVLLIFIAFAPNLPIALGLLFAVSLLSKMDVPTRQAYVMALVNPTERTAAAGYTNTARSVFRPFGPILAGASQSVFLGLPFLIAGTIKGAYDLVLWNWFRNVELPEETLSSVASTHPALDRKSNVQITSHKEM
jgi:MFS family permease